MKKLYKITLALGLSTAMLGSTLLLSATGENGDDTIFDNHVFYEQYYEYQNSVQTNLYANNLPGVVVLTPQNEVFDMLEYTAEERYDKLPILFADEYLFPDDKNDDKLIEDAVQKLGGEALSYWTLLFFRGTGWDNTQLTTLPQEISLCFQINADMTVNYQKINAYDLSEYEFSVARVHDGVVTILKDQDDNPRTLTVMTDKFSTYALVISTPGEVDAYIETYQSSDTAVEPTPSSQADTSDLVLDSVPKTGER